MAYFSRPPVQVAAADVSRNFGRWQDRAQECPVVVTSHGRPKTYLLSVEHFGLNQSPPPIIDMHGARLSALINAMAQGFVALDEELHLLEANPALLAYIGMSAEQVLNRSLVDIFPEHANGLLVEHAYRCLRTGEPAEFEMDSVIRAGRSVLMRVFPYGRGVGVLVFNRTHERDLERRLGEMSAVRQAVEAIPGLGLVEINLRGRLTRADAAFERLTSFAGDALITFRLSDIVIPKDRARVMMEIESAIDGGPAKPLHTSILAKDGREEPVLMTMAPICRQGRSVGVQVSILPLTTHAQTGKNAPGRSADRSGMRPAGSNVREAGG